MSGRAVEPVATKWLGTAYSAPDQISDEVLTAHEMTRDFYEAFVRERAERDRSAPKFGDPAPDFSAERLAADGRRGGAFRLSEARGRPVALAFGSYTAPPFRRRVPQLNELYDELHDRVDFYCVYIHEAHPDDGWQIAANVDDQVVYDEPVSIEERTAVARDFVSRSGLRLPLLLDDMANEVDRLYAGMPMRLYLIDEQQRVAFRTIVGSPGFDMDAWAEALRTHVGPAAG